MERMCGPIRGIPTLVEEEQNESDDSSRNRPTKWRSTLLDFPESAIKPTVLLLMAVVKADRKVLKAETDLAQAFFSRQLRVAPEQLATVRTLIARYSHDELPEAELNDAIERVPEGARDLLFSVAVEIAIVDNNLVAEERLQLLEIGQRLGLKPTEVRARLREAVARREDAFSLLGVEPEVSWREIEVAYLAERDRYSPSKLAGLGVAFQNLALEKLERIEWAFSTLKSIFRHATSEADEVGSVLIKEATRNPESTIIKAVEFSELRLPATLEERLEGYEIHDTEGLEEFLNRDTVEGLHKTTELLFVHLLACIENSKSTDGELDFTVFNEFFPEQQTLLSRIEPPDQEVYPTELATQDAATLWRDLPNILRPLWENETAWEIVTRRFGLFQSPRQTAEEIGVHDGLTRQQVMELEGKARSRLRALLLTGSHKGIRLNPRLVWVCTAVFEAIQDASREPVCTLPVYIHDLEEKLGWQPYSPTGFFPMFEEWLDLRHHTELDHEFVFRSHTSKQIRTFTQALKSVQEKLLANPHSVELAELYGDLQSYDEKLNCGLESLLALTPGIVWKDDGTVCLPLATNNGPEPAKTERKSDTLLTIMEKVMDNHRGPITIAELTSRVRTQRPGCEDAILAYLSTEDRFVRTGFDSYALARRTDRTQDWNKKEVGEVVERFFAQSFHSSVPFKQLVDYLQTKTELPNLVAAGILRYHPAIRRERCRGVLHARFRRDWRTYKPKSRFLPNPIP
jgi:Tellurite resistance protein TerB